MTWSESDLKVANFQPATANQRRLLADLGVETDEYLSYDRAYSIIYHTLRRINSKRLWFSDMGHDFGD